MCVCVCVCEGRLTDQEEGDFWGGGERIMMTMRMRMMMRRMMMMLLVLVLLMLLNRCTDALTDALVPNDNQLQIRS